MYKINQILSDKGESEMSEEELLSNSSTREQQVQHDTGEVQCEINKLEDNEMNLRANKRNRNESEIVDVEGFHLVTSQRAKRLTRSNSNNERIEMRNSEDRDINKFEVCMTSKEPIPKQIGLAKLLNSANIPPTVKIIYRNPYKVLLQFEKKDDAAIMIKNKSLIDKGYRCHLTSEVNFSYGVVKNLELDVEEQEMLDNFRSDCEIISIKRLKRMSNTGDWVDSETVRFCFNSSKVPTHIYGYGCRFTVQSYVFPVSQCSHCWKYGHLTRSCPSKHIVCPKCGGRHPNCETNRYTCINCKGKHMALDKSCPVFFKEKQIRNIMSRDNCTYNIAMTKYLKGKSSITNDPIEESNSTLRNPSISLYTYNSQKRTYQEVLTGNTISVSQERENNLEKEEEEEEVSESDIEESESLKEEQSTHKNNIREKKKKKKKHQEREVVNHHQPLDCTTVRKEAQESTKRNERLSFKSILLKIQNIFYSKNNINDKFQQILKLLIDGIISVVMNSLREVDLFKKIIDSFYNGQ